jgi:hypothetical protein
VSFLLLCLSIIKMSCTLKVNDLGPVLLPDLSIRFRPCFCGSGTSSAGLRAPGVLRRLWSGWKTPLVLVTPRTVVGWHRAGFRLYWKWLSRARQVGGRKPVGEEIRALIFRMAAENPTWGAPRIHGELLKLGFNVSEPTVSRWLRRTPRSPDVGKRC